MEIASNHYSKSLLGIFLNQAVSKNCQQIKARNSFHQDLATNY